MAGPPTAAFSQLRVRWEGTSLPYGALTTHGITTPTGPFADVQLAIADFAGILLEQLSGDVNIPYIDWKVGPEATGPTFRQVVGLAGDLAKPTAPPNATILVRATVAGVSGRFAGRFNLPGADETQIDGAGNLFDVYGGEINNKVDDAYEALAAVGGDPVVFSEAGGDPRPVEAFNVQLKMATQRRRLRR